MNRTRETDLETIRGATIGRLVGALAAAIVLLAPALLPARAQAQHGCNFVGDPCLDGAGESDGDLCTVPECRRVVTDSCPCDSECNAEHLFLGCLLDRGPCNICAEGSFECVDNGDLQAICPQSDNDPCTGAPICEPETGCGFEDAAFATPCASDGVFCNGSEACLGGECIGHTGNPCAARVGDADDDCSESCNETSDACTSLDPVGSTCSDGLFCNGVESCAAIGTGQFSTRVCAGSTGNPCPGPDGDADCTETCNEAADACNANDPLNSVCSDGLFCNGTESCRLSGDLGSLTMGCQTSSVDPCAARVGDADNDCSESCNEASDACTANDPSASICSDGLFCNGIDRCIGGSCAVHVGNPCAANLGDPDNDCSESCNENSDACSSNDPNGSACSDGVFCNGTDTCSAGACSRHVGNPCPGADADSDCSETCNETSDDCTGNDPNLSACASDSQPCTNDVCSAVGTCTHPAANAGTTCRTAAPGGCDVAEICDGTSGACPVNGFAPVTQECRAAANVCDLAETCDGGTAACPPDGWKTAGATCRTGSGDTCDPPEVCDGVAGHACPATNVVTAVGTTCRAGSGDSCDPTEACDGIAGHVCPTNVVTAGNTVCRARVDTTCDVAERCSGAAGQACPADAGVAAGTTCRAAVDVCDFTETCGGATTTCPSNQKKPDTDQDTLCDEIDNCDLVANSDQADPDNDDVGTACDNCPSTCNPDQDNADGDAGGGDVCDVCPAIDEAAEPAECATATYNSALACCRDSASDGVSVDADGGACGAAGDVTLQTPPDPTTGTTVTVEIPSGAVDLSASNAPSMSISVTPMTQGGGDFILSTGVGKFVAGAIMEPAGATFDPPLLVCMAWQDANNNGRVDNLEFVVEEANIRPTLRDETDETLEVVLGPRCGLQAVCGPLGANGLPATVPGTLNDPTLEACCSTAANVYCFEVNHFSAYAIADLSCSGEATARIIATRMGQPAGGQDLKVKGEFDLGGQIAGGLDPATSGFELLILSAAGTPLYQVTLPAGAYSRETGEGWKPSPRGGKAQWKSKTGISGVDKVKLEWDDGSGEGSFDLSGKGVSLAVTPADLPLQAEVRLDPSALAGRCGVATWAPPGGICAFNGSASTLLCQ